MNDLQPDPVAVQAPVAAIGWSPARGFIDDADDLQEARFEGELILDVTDPTTGRVFGVVEAVEGDCPLAVAVRQDREICELRRVHARLAERVSDLGDRAEGLDIGLATEVAALKHRVRMLEQR
ncbi:hypothetical protein BH23ACT10_BH23ACT10_10760 [soil metagenome]